MHELRKRTEQRSVPATTMLSRADPVPNEHNSAAPSTSRTEGLRWPRWTAAVGAALLLGWLAGIVAGPLVAIVGAVRPFAGRSPRPTHWRGRGRVAPSSAARRRHRPGAVADRHCTYSSTATNDQPRRGDFGEAVTAILASFGLAVLLVEGLLPGFWMIGGYVCMAECSRIPCYLAQA